MDTLEKRAATARTRPLPVPLHLDSPAQGADGGVAPHRMSWALERAWMETNDVKSMPHGKRRARHWKAFKLALKQFDTAMRVMGLRRRGVRNALDIRLNEFDLAFAGLPPAFDGYRLLHLTDLHIDAHPDLPDRILDAIGGLTVDTMVLTGDYRFRVHGPFDQIFTPLRRLLDGVETADGAFAVLGNHDSFRMADPMDAIGYRMLINETVTLRRGGETIHLTGVDDVHYYYTDAAQRALNRLDDGFHIALVHSPEFVDQSRDAGVALYLTGHTHGGQVCLPGGMPVLTNAGNRRFARGVWRHGDMVGFTGLGAGVSGLPIRYFSHGEAALITLRTARI